MGNCFIDKNMKNNHFTVSIGIPVHNEAENILNLLDSIVRQTHENFKLEKIYVICDGTTDKTDELVTRYIVNKPEIELINDKRRIGKLQRLIEVYKTNNSDIIIIFDGDFILSEPKVLAKIVQYFDDNSVTGVSANNQPLQAKTFTGKLINYWSHVWYLTRIQFNNGDNIHNARGCGMAIRKEFAKQIVFPKDVVSEAQYIYPLCLTSKKRFHFAKDAVILYRKPESLHDYILQSRRSTPEKFRLENIFGVWVKNLYVVPTQFKLSAVVQAFLSNPVLLVTSALFNLIVDKLPYNNVHSKNESVWKRASSTKKAIPVPF